MYVKFAIFFNFFDNNWVPLYFQLSDVEEGGGTGFTFLKLLVKPRKGSLLFWYNLHASGDEDYRSNHGACPVLKGSKWSKFDTILKNVKIIIFYYFFQLPTFGLENVISS